jgi:hypothetical protein
MGNKRYDTPLAATPEPTYTKVQSIMTSKENQNQNRYSAMHKEFSNLQNSDGSGMNSFTKQNEKENGKIKYKSYDVSTDASGNPTRLEINRQTNTGNSRTRVITNPKKIERKMTRVINRNK